MAPNAQGQRVEIQGTVWTNAAGESLKAWIKPMNMETFRVTREVALAKTPLAKLDLGEATLVKVDRAIPHAHDTKWVRYRVQLHDGDPLAAFPASLPRRSSGSMSIRRKSRSAPFAQLPIRANTQKPRWMFPRTRIAIRIISFKATIR